MARITGLSTHLARLSRLSGQPVAMAIDEALLDGAKLIAIDASNSIKDGAVSGPGHVPSVAPNPPNADTHVLDESIVAVGGGVEGERAGLKATVIAGAPYAIDQEFGNSRLPERPYLRPATQRNRIGVVTGVKAAVDRVVRQRG